MKKEKQEKEVDVLDELSKGTCMGMDAIHFIIDKVKEEELHNELNRQYEEYKRIKEKIDELYPEYSDKHPHETGIMNKTMTWYGIEMKTMMDDTTSKLAELLMQGTNMGIIEGRRLLNKNEEDEQINNLLSEYVSMQEEAVEKLKEFL